MPPAHRHSDTRPAEQVLEDLLRPWPPSAEPRTKAAPKRRPFATAFLPNAAQHAPRLPLFRVQTDPAGRVALRPMPGADGDGSKLSRLAMPSFRVVADTVEARATGSGTIAEEADIDADEVSRLAPTSPLGGDDVRFAVQVIALTAAGALVGPAAGRSNLAASGYAELGGDHADDGVASAETSDGRADGIPDAPSQEAAATVELGPGLGDRGQGYSRAGAPAFPFAADDDAAPAPRSIFL